MTILSINNLSKSYKHKKILDGINLTINSPGIWALVGPNGVGKTTFLNVVTNLLPATSGNIELMGKSNKDVSVFKDVSFLQDNSVLYDYLNGYDHLAFICDAQKILKERMNEVVKYVGMESYVKMKIKDYSLGMKQHLLLAMAILNKPKLMFLDEPLNGLDPTSAILMRKILLRLVDEGTTIILSSHNLSEIDRVTKKILFLKDGKLIEEDMTKYEKIYYHFLFSDLKHTQHVLLQENVQTVLTKNSLRIQLEHHTIQDLITIFHSHQINIIDIQKEVIGSEKRYEEVFNVCGDKT
ncbi:ABC transporter ATP-binding protein [Bacillus wiedmannii]|uniref:ABC transporter ATP-binding protein n=1 Tax=Bacillus wiedmannii TaxID=1890302 RepID=UPI000BEDD8E3|nr:ABC transporter ATP-binding protein [Bacillus wiedmannii]PEA75287.1 ABC transporter ATP-binding protein [Bacillus wiedmannii]PEG07807.1 ABC transporter ATP-binding protein [Bacillus wiedmannii]PEL43387.1 ABC transporter ATP-binding protein [Bacillus wiedmannii]PEO95364.1 ABC transporter ATP-binding protein [Bacillus wiedmannii]PGA25590.1 ABC transporter ATP-binding protein [Bacillus wiedmannii]